MPGVQWALSPSLRINILFTEMVRSGDSSPNGIGIFGGTFNPIHLGHLIIAGKVRESLNLEKIIFVPAHYPPHKKAPEIGSLHRYRMVKLAISNNFYFVASKIELEREGKSYTIDTVNALKKMYLPEKDFYFILGLDAYLETGSWKDIEKLKKLVTFVVVKRPGYENNSKFKTTKSLRDRRSWQSLTSMKKEIASLTLAMTFGWPWRLLRPPASQ